MRSDRAAGRSGAPATAVALGCGLVSTGLVLAYALDRVGRPGPPLGLLHLALWSLFALGAGALLRAPARTAVPLLVAVGVLLQAAVVAGPPRTTDDYLRYAWDGRVQAAGVSPYAHPPGDPALAPLRDEWLFPGPAWCAGRGRPLDCPRLNHPTSPTIYPPVAQLWFLGVHAASPPGARSLPLQAGAGLLAVATTLLLLRVLRRAGADPRLAVLWAWCPTVVLEAGGGAHVDALAALLSVAALGLAASRRPLWGAALVGAAAAVKLLPFVLLPALTRRRWPAAAGVAVGVFAASYLPHVLAVGPRVLGFLPGYLDEEGFAGDGGRFPLVGLVAPSVAAPVVAAAVLAGAALRARSRVDPARPWDAALAVTGVAFLVVGPTYPWYALLLVALAALAGRPAWLAVAAAGYVGYLGPDLGLSPGASLRLGYGAALLVVLAAHARAARRPSPGHPSGDRPRPGDLEPGGRDTPGAPHRLTTDRRGD